MKLTPEQLNTFEAAVGQNTQNDVQKLLSSQSYQCLTDAEKSNAITSLISKVRKDVRGTIDIKNGSTQSMAPQGDVYVVIDLNGNVKRIDPPQPIEKPTYTGSSVLDKLETSKYNSRITQRINDVYALYKDNRVISRTMQ